MKVKLPLQHFLSNKHCKGKIKQLIPGDVLGTHRAISVPKAKEYLEKVGSQNIEITPIGSKVFGGFCKRASQSMSNTNHTPRWIDAYEEKLLDYYLIKAQKHS